PGEAECELAGALLRLWALQRDPDLLAEAERAARAAAALPGRERARALLGRVLYERAEGGLALAEVSREEAESLLAAADAEFAAVAAVPGLDRTLRLDCVVRRARTLTLLSNLQNDPAPLREALSALESALRAEGASGSDGPSGSDRQSGADGSPGGEEPDAEGRSGGGPDDGGWDAEGRDAGGRVGKRPNAGGLDDGTRDGRSRDVGDPDRGGRDRGGPEGGGPEGGGPDHGRPEGGGPNHGDREAGGPDRGGPVAAVPEPAEALVAPAGALVAPAGALVAPEVALEATLEAALEAALGRVLLALLDHTPTPADRLPLARRAATHLATALASLLRDADPSARSALARARLDLAAALRHLPDRLDEAPGQLSAALDEAAGDPELRLAGLVCLARVHRARYARDGDPAALEAAADAYGRARRLIPRDGDAYGELLPEWGEALLDRARAEDGRRFASTAVRVLRESRAAVPQSDPRSAARLLSLATGLRLRHTYENDLVDLREAEYLLELAVRHSRHPLDQARAWRDHGDLQQEIHAHTRTLERLDRAADSYRRAWRAALQASRSPEAPPTPSATADTLASTALELAAHAQHLRGEVLERLSRPRAALDAYRAALTLWSHTPTPPPPTLRTRIQALESTL
ncbi:hypothetical protein GPJ59_10530, partial [Streptomyces bambusae]|nr:hypothetical protein [Streptomyces bambusae]